MLPESPFPGTRPHMSMKKKIKKNTVFVKTRARLRQAVPGGENPAPPCKSERPFSESRDIREDRAIRQLKTTLTTTQRKGLRKTKLG